MPRTDSASRVIAAPADRVFAALIEPDALQVWLPPTGMVGHFEHYDARPGGSYRLILTYRDSATAHGKATADTDVVEARFLDITPGHRIVTAVDFASDQPDFAGTMTMTWQLRTEGERTEVTIQADDVPDGISEQDHAVGLASSLTNLASYLER